MTWFVVFALSAFGLWYWRHYAVQQRDLESASSPQRKGERFIGQVVTVPKGIEHGLHTIFVAQPVLQHIELQPAHRRNQ